MSYGRRGGRWGANFISASGPNRSLSTATIDDEEEEDNRPAAVKGARPGINRQGYNTEFANPTAFTPNYGTAVTGRAFANLGRKRVQDEDDYFNEEGDSNANLLYQPAEGSPSALDHGNNDINSDDSDDPLDQYMQGINNEVKNIKEGKEKKDKKSVKGERFDIEKEDEIESYLRFMEENPNVGITGEEEEIYEYDSEGNIVAHKKKEIDPLPPIDHSTINYKSFSKNFYTPHVQIECLDYLAVQDLRDKLGLKVRGINPVAPVCSFAHLSLDEPLVEAIRKAGYTQPTPIQAQGVPVVLSGRDLIGIAKTGSGKTAAFLWPMIVHIMDQPELQFGDGPIGVICAPTRELAQQIYSEAKKLAKVYNLTVVCAYGGGSMWDQQKACESGCEILICTPGRMIDLIKKKSTNLRRVTYLVFDEADKMFNLGFALLFSATFKSRLEKLARDILTEPIRIVQGTIGEANEDITQIVEIFNTPEEKWNWLCMHLVSFTAEGSVIVFVTRKVNADDVANRLKSRDMKVLLLHGDMHQSDRNSVILSFKKLEAPILVATDVASRGLDIPSVHNVVNFEVARDIDTHTHRVGRTGRAGQKGKAYTLFVKNKDSHDFAAHLVKHLETSNQNVPDLLLQIAQKCNWFSRNRSKVLSNNEPARPGIGFQPREKKIVNPVNSNGKKTDESSGSESLSNVPYTDRITAMRDAFAVQFNRRFVSAGVEGKQFVHPQLHQSSTKGDQTAPRKKSRWD